MSRSRKKVLKYGDRFNVYISELIEEEILDFLNIQTDLTATVMAGIIKLYQDNGKVDLVNYLPRTYSSNSIIPSQLVNNNNMARTQIQQPIQVQQHPIINPSIEPSVQRGSIDSAKEELTATMPVRTVAEEPKVSEDVKETTPMSEDVEETTPMSEDVEETTPMSEVAKETPTKSGFLNNSSVGNMAMFAMQLNKKKE